MGNFWERCKRCELCKCCKRNNTNGSNKEDGSNKKFIVGNINQARKRPIKIASFLVCLFTTIGIFYYGILEKTEFTCKKYNTTTNADGKITLYTREEKTTFPVFFNLGLGLLGILLGVFFDRICLFIEEIYLGQLKIRHHGKCLEMLKKCFSGISWRAVTVVVLTIGGSVALGRETPLKVADGIYVLGGIGVGPLLIHLLNLNSESEIDLSRTLEEKKLYPGYTLAWSYYLLTLQKVIEHFNGLLKRKPEPVKLAFKRLILILIPGTDIENMDDLIQYDEKIKKTEEDSMIYELTAESGSKELFAMHCIREPLVALKEMRELEKVKFVDEKTYTDEVQRFNDTLNDILEEAPHDQFTRKGLVVLFKVEIGQYEENFKEGGLVKLIQEAVGAIDKRFAPSDPNSVSNKGPSSKSEPPRPSDDNEHAKLVSGEVNIRDLNGSGSAEYA